MLGTGSLHQKFDLIITATPSFVDKAVLPHVNTAARQMEMTITAAWYKTHLSAPEDHHMILLLQDILVVLVSAPPFHANFYHLTLLLPSVFSSTLSL